MFNASLAAFNASCSPHLVLFGMELFYLCTTGIIAFRTPLLKRLSILDAFHRYSRSRNHYNVMVPTTGLEFGIWDNMNKIMMLIRPCWSCLLCNSDSSRWYEIKELLVYIFRPKQIIFIMINI